MSQVVNHLLFHKAMVGIDVDRVDQYIEIMYNLKLSKPKMIDTNVSRNLMLGSI